LERPDAVALGQQIHPTRLPIYQTLTIRSRKSKVIPDSVELFWAAKSILRTLSVCPMLPNLPPPTLR
jgi:hypothetical protein